MIIQTILAALGLDSLMQAHSKRQLSAIRLESETRSGEYRRGCL